jgi:RimJ/RimL family protein N-acetyltransferase
VVRDDDLARGAIKALDDVWMTGDAAAILDCFEPDVVFFGSGDGEQAVGHAELEAMLEMLAPHAEGSELAIQWESLSGERVDDAGRRPGEILRHAGEVQRDGIQADRRPCPPRREVAVEGLSRQPAGRLVGRRRPAVKHSRGIGLLREVVEADLPVFYEHQRDPGASAMAAFPSRDSDAFMAHWARTLANDSALTWTIVCDGAVAGNIGCWEDDGRRFVGYWIGRQFWGRGLATRALAELLDLVDWRPLHAYVAESNVASIRVLEKCGFSRVEAHQGDDGIEELLLELRA